MLSEDAQALDEVVVTALGIKREAKALTYNVQEIKAAGITKVKDANFVNSLSGKIAGVTINQSSSGTVDLPVLSCVERNLCLVKIMHYMFWMVFQCRG